MRILQWNLKGLFNNYPDLNILINEFSPHVIALQETHLPTNKTAYTPHKYIGYFHNLPQNKSAKQGIALFIKKHIKHKRIPVFSNISAIAIEINIGFKFSIVTCYIPPNQKFTAGELIGVINAAPAPTIIIGDFNAWSPLWGSTFSNGRGQIMEDVILSKNLFVLNDRSPTHFSSHKTFTHIDIALCSASIAHKLCSYTLEDLHNSDHFPIITSLITPMQYIIKPRSKFLTDKADWLKYCSLLNTSTSAEIISENINAEASKIKRIIRSAAHISIPQASTKKFSAKLPYWSNLLTALRNTKQALWSKFKQSVTTENLIRYKKANSNFRRELKSAKRIALEKLTANIKPTSSSKKIWNDIKSLSGEHKQNKIDFIQSPVGPIYDPQHIAENFAQTWSNNSKNFNFHPNFITLSNQIISQTYHNPSPCFEATLIESPITLEEFDSTISKMSGKTPGSDKISYPLLKNLPYSLKIRLITLYNNILKQGIVPQEWKKATIIPIPKPNKSSASISDFRPISLIPCIAKVLEKIISKRLMWFLKQKGLISPNQFGFQSGLGVIDPLLYFEHHAATTISTKNHLSVLSLDFEKAFDRIGAHTVLQELKKWDIGDKTYNFIKSFLSNRKITVSVNNQNSNIYPLHNGIPQGSPLSTTLFIIAFNQLSNLITSYRCVDHIIYADDVLIFSALKNLNQVKIIFSNILTEIAEWSKTSGTKVSASKSATFHVCRKRKCTFPNLSFESTQIPHTTTLRILGLIFDKKLTFKEHCKYVRLSLLNRLNIIKFLSSKHCHIHISTLVNIVKALMLSKIDFGLAIYGHCAKSHLALVETPYHIAVKRSIRAFPTSPTKVVLTEAGLPSIPLRTKQNTMMLIPKLLQCKNSLLFNAMKTYRTTKKLSTIVQCINIIKKLDIISTPQLIKENTHPHWLTLKSSIISTLFKYQKSTTNAEQYNQLFNDAVNTYKPEWKIIYTDGSKSDTHTSFAVTNDQGVIITVGVLPPYCSILTAEAAAIYEAVLFIVQSKEKHIICSDSKSTITALLNDTNNSVLIKNIKDILYKHKNIIKIMWIPGHAGIRGNQLADDRAKKASREPVFSYAHVTSKDIRNLLKKELYESNSRDWIDFQHQYKEHNPTGVKPNYPSDCSCQYIKIFVRLRLGHTLRTHNYLLNKTEKPSCTLCNHPNDSVNHILNDCTALAQKRKTIFGNREPSRLLKTPNIDNINAINSFLKICKINNI
ncbi:RNA-directed DNA polymerase from mobile element jockey isoform X1 [Bactrocera dorsalis]|uniref:RNA-directed DNA polymerase from mobile element jockey isoform X1 n=1 Tax=Bactrocera dorsalis TaxID=27457 RepID=A0ABM3K3Z1_BACDO|nr:RNA-directed DNA polymerase from mobile element jockey isoform X1 [Bactrocera dorsalis]XP_049316161.1 RNA-directed DNA polymerase from mobile element jockey isoform X1 [Bactrocera dorsalis]XP_049316162.1 RNA-directed DNA polymerase from mobile element jockey isoform X1 [Bactrocera dorsalis]XP_049316163.1 RNA-directed DNA polymerase from mobile element jockey isoform X1 [Bactrocera dorsalis]XP_049316164.1 RNA-directed DNA polymerase from mobile element jockey isoform X1 [Bactrocera dorsalis]